MPTFALISRFMTSDIPYLPEWFEYYYRLGINHFYLYYVDKRYINVEHACQPYIGKNYTIRLVNPRNRDINLVLRDIPYSIKEDYCIHVDSDEFLWLNEMTLSQFVERYNTYNSFTFPWLMCPNRHAYSECLDDILKDSENPKYFVPMTKMMARTDCIHFGNDCHSFIPRQPFQTLDCLQKELEQSTGDPQYYLIHFCYRGVYDVYNRTVHTNLQNHKRDGLTIFDPTKRTIMPYEIPSRITCYLGEMDNANKRKTTIPTLELTGKTNIDLLLSLPYTNMGLFQSRIQRLLRYRLYRNHVMGRMPKIALARLNLRMTQPLLLD